MWRGRVKLAVDRGLSVLSSGLQEHIPHSPKASTQQVNGPGPPLSSRMPRKDSIQEESLLGL